MLQRLTNVSNGNKKLKSLEDFKNESRRWELDGCDIKLCKNFVSKLEYVNLVGVLDIGLTVRMRNMAWFEVLGNVYNFRICLLGVDMGRPQRDV